MMEGFTKAPSKIIIDKEKGYSSISIRVGIMDNFSMIKKMVTA